MEERKRREEEESREQSLHDKHVALIDRTLQLRDRDSARSRRELARAQNEENAALAAEQKVGLGAARVCACYPVPMLASSRRFSLLTPATGATRA
jgi:hypothetical protein